MSFNIFCLSVNVIFFSIKIRLKRAIIHEHSLMFYTYFKANNYYFFGVVILLFH